MYETEAKRRIKNEPAVAFDLPQRGWFPSSALAEEEVVESDRVAGLWTFL